MKRTVPADNFCGTLAANVDNDKLSDEEFRAFVRNSIDIVIFKRRCYHFDTEKEYHAATNLQRCLKEEKCQKCNGTGYHN
jgi:hypothetical protein